MSVFSAPSSGLRKLGAAAGDSCAASGSGSSRRLSSVAVTFEGSPREASCGYLNAAFSSRMRTSSASGSALSRTGAGETVSCPSSVLSMTRYSSVLPLSASAAYMSHSAMHFDAKSSSGSMGVVRFWRIFSSLPPGSFMTAVIISRSLARVRATYKSRISSESISRRAATFIACCCMLGRMTLPPWE